MNTGDFMKNRKIKKSLIRNLIIAVFIAVVAAFIVMYINYKNSNEYKLKEIGYNKEEIKELINVTTKDQLNTVLNIEYTNFLIDLFKEKYFIWDNFEAYRTYKLENADKSLTDVVAIINVKANNEWYSEDVIEEADLNKGNLILVNKFNYLTKEYTPEDNVKISNWYSYENNYIKSEVYEEFVNMFNAAKKKDLTIIANSSFRDFEEQDDTYNYYMINYGKEYANKYAALPGFSEHQTGLAIDIATHGSTMENFKTSEEYAWLVANAHEFGFILRYPEGKEYLTGYEYESWHYRFVGREVATEIKNLGITFDEYYAYYLK